MAERPPSVTPVPTPLTWMGSASVSIQPPRRPAATPAVVPLVVAESTSPTHPGCGGRRGSPRYRQILRDVRFSELSPVPIPAAPVADGTAGAAERIFQIRHSGEKRRYVACRVWGAVRGRPVWRRFVGAGGSGSRSLAPGVAPTRLWESLQRLSVERRSRAPGVTPVR